ncbi:hypothetical protein U8C37_06760 [Sinorhizobium medicae]|uniref:hypothetical protein n=1 Tax=Sinorhizobium medicae TaxID=110321 RepID=UPI002AF6B1FA|nr:hypothetical protein [Sinorhizobium medicae]WQO87069.1 hypothetical protein U8C37_06760 [Sinorhizobium medicae]
MSLLSLAFYPFQSLATVPEATIGEAFPNPFSSNIDDVSDIEDLMLLSARISHCALLDEEVAVLFDSHFLKPLKCSIAHRYLIHLMRVEHHGVGVRRFR